MLPHDWLPKSPGYDSFSPWRDDGTWAKIVNALRARTRVAAGHAPPSAACLESQSVKTTEVGGPERGEDGGKKMKGRQRHLLVDTLGLLLAVGMTSAALEDGVVATTLRGHVWSADLPRLCTIFADKKYPKHALDAWMAEHRPAGHLESKRRPEGTTGFTPLAKRWGVERTNAWHGRYRRHSKASERRVESRTVMMQMSHRQLMVNRLAPGRLPAFHYRTEDA
jgi:putative transposase